MKSKSKIAHIHEFSVDMSYAQCEELYRQHIQFLIVTNTSGKRIRLPKQNLQQFVSPYGLKGVFELATDQNNRIISLKRKN